MKLNWELSKFKGGKKWVSWGAGCWVTHRKGQPLHVGFSGVYLGEWHMEPKEAKLKLEQMHFKQIAKN